MAQFQSHDTTPLWSQSAVIHKQPQQSGEINVDVCVIGAGITGLTAAELLKRTGKTVAVIDIGRVGMGETGHTTGHITEVFDLSYRDLISRFGIEGAQLAAQSMRRAIERIEENVDRLGIDCGLKRVSGYRYADRREDIDVIEEESEAAIRAGVPNELLMSAPLPFDTLRAMRFDHQAQFHPLKYLAGLAKVIPGDGSYIFEETRMLDVEEGEPCRVTTDRGVIVADDVFVAANVPSTNRFFMHTKLAAYRTYAMAARVSDRFDHENLFWDTRSPYHYIRSFEPVPGQRLLIVGGEDHKTGQDGHASDHFDRLEDWLEEHFDVETISHRWSGQIIEPADGLFYIGRNPLSDHVFVATGFSGTGLTGGTIGGMMVSDMIIGNQNPWIDLYDAARLKPFASMKNFITENIDFPSHLIGDRLNRAQAKGTELIRENEGQLVRIGGKKVAAYRDPQGELHLLSPVCPHLGCYVHWNDAEKSWDCPCHGSRFDPVGKLLNGPAVSDLASESYDENAAVIPERYEQPARLNDSPLGQPLVTLFSCPCKAKPT